MATNRDWSNGHIELPATGDIALSGSYTGGTDPGWKITAGGALTVATVAVGNSAAGSTPGTCVKKIQVFDAAGTSLGYVAVYDAIT